MYAFLGVLSGAFSLLILPHPLLRREHPTRFHGISLVISPIIVGLVLSSFGAVMRRWGKKVTPSETFGYRVRLRARNGGHPLLFCEVTLR